MIEDRVRMDAYRRALARVIRSDSVVLDIGAGTGILSLLACQLGAQRVFAVEPSHAIRVAQEIAEANGYRDRIQFFQAVSTSITLPQRADVIVSDMRGVLPFHQEHIPSVIDARTRLLAPGGVLIPREDTVWAAPVEAPNVYDRVVLPWTGDPYGIDLRRAQSLATNTWTKARVTPAQLLSPPQQWITIDYESTERSGAERELRFVAERPGTLHGVVLWFDADLGGDVRFSNAPGAPELIYGHAFFPLTAPVPLNPGDVIVIDLHADLVGDEYVWRWFTRVIEDGPSGRITASYRQSTFQGELVAAASLRMRSAKYVPHPRGDAAVDSLILSLMDGRTASGDIARTVMANFPSRFSSWEGAVARVGELSLEYSE
jgi:protein arginine N-methyltransferase 1